MGSEAVAPTQTAEALVSQLSSAHEPGKLALLQAAASDARRSHAVRSALAGDAGLRKALARLQREAGECQLAAAQLLCEPVMARFERRVMHFIDRGVKARHADASPELGALRHRTQRRRRSPAALRPLKKFLKALLLVGRRIGVGCRLDHWAVGSPGP